jgi:hypothetical protein
MDFQRVRIILNGLENFELMILLFLTVIAIVGGFTAIAAYGRLVVDEWRIQRNRRARHKAYIEGHTKVDSKRP